jgi:hypothetical protein
MANKEIFCFLSSNGRLDSGMTLQLLNDYGHLCKAGNQAYLPLIAGKNGDQKKSQTMRWQSNLTR